MEMAYILQLAQLAGYVVIATIFIVMIKADVKVIKMQMTGIEVQLAMLSTSFSKLGDIMRDIAVQNAEIVAIKDDIRELRHGRGFVNVNGEYNIRGKIEKK
jgi:hypothetical protein